MVFVTQAAKSVIYTEIQKRAPASVCSVLIFVAPTVDALCALKILVHMFKTDFIPFKIVPISGFKDLTAANEELLQGHDDVRTIIMLGCGGIVDLSEFISVSEDINIYVFDNHRPYNLNNIFGNSQITVVDDGYIEASKEDLEDAYVASTLTEEDYEEDEEDDYSDLDEDENELNSENLSPSGSPSKKRLSSRAYKEICREKFETYANCFWKGPPLSAALFDLCESRGCSNNDLLWYAITGVTDLFLGSTLIENAYTEYLSQLKRVQERLNPNIAQKSKAESTSLTMPQNLVNTDGVISYEHDMKFVLMRHWTLYNSMLHSDFVASRMSAWREKGRKQLELLLAKMGFPLNQCKSDYSAMDLEYRELLTIQLEKFSEEFNIQRYLFPSFTRDFGYLLKISAADCVHSLRSILESPNYVTLSRTGIVAADSGPIWKSNFFFAFDSIDYKNTDHLKAGLDLAIKQHMIVFKEASIILSHKSIRLSRSFRYVVIRNGVDLDWLQNVNTLRRLSKFLVDSTKNIRKGSALPLVLAVWNSLRDTFVIVATDGESYFDDASSNPSIIGPIFNRAAQNMGARVKMDTFDLSCIEVKSSDLKGFIKSLQSVMSTLT